MTALAQALRDRIEMLRRNAVVAGFTAVIFVASAHGQSPTNPKTAVDFMADCRSYGQTELVFVGRVDPAVTYRISGEAEIEVARQNLARVEAEVARLRASLDLRTRFEREAEFVLRIIQAQAELDMRRGMYPAPYDLTLIPVHVEQAFRGVTTPTLMLRRVDPSIKLEPGELYFISGHRERDAIAGFPGRADIFELEYVNPGRVTNVASAQREVQFLASATITILGRLRMRSHGDLASAPLSGIRILVSSETHVVETMTGNDGSFAVSGLQRGRFEITPVLHEELIIINKSALTIDAREGGCKAVGLTAALNGRVRGRIFSATGASLDGVELFLQGMAPNGRVGGSHSLQSSTRPSDDGTFEFSGVFPGSYSLMARVPRTVDGKTRYSITYFPGTPDLASARPIVVGRATLHDGFDFLVTTE